VPNTERAVDLFLVSGSERLHSETSRGGTTSTRAEILATQKQKSQRRLAPISDSIISLLQLLPEKFSVFEIYILFDIMSCVELLGFA